MKALHNLHPAKGSQRKRKRIGRGNSSGSGNYSGKGMKGQRSRSGGKKGLQKRSMKSYLLRIPKRKGFTTFRSGWLCVTIGILQKNYKESETVTPQNLRAKALVRGTGKGIKILADGSLGKKLTVKAHSFSVAAKEKIEKAGGEVIVLKILKAVEAEKKAAAKKVKIEEKA